MANSEDGLQEVIREILAISSIIILLALIFMTKFPSDFLNPLNESGNNAQESITNLVESPFSIDLLVNAIGSLFYILYMLIKTMVEVAWKIPYLDIWSWWTLGVVAEKYYTGRPTLFSNAMTLIIFSKRIDIKTLPVNEILVFLYLGFGIIVAIVGIVTYQQDKKLSQDYYDVTKWLYGSITTGILILAAYLFLHSPDPPI